MRLMSFFLTAEAFRQGRKTVTRRLGWAWLRPGDRLEAVVKARGVSIRDREQLGVIEIVSVDREKLKDMGASDVAREGFDPTTWSRLGFIQHFCRNMKCTPETIVTRIEFKVLVHSAKHNPRMGPPDPPRPARRRDFA